MQVKNDLTPLIGALQSSLDLSRVKFTPVESMLYGRDALGSAGGSAGVVCFPLTTEEVQACVRIARRYGHPVIPRGSGTGLAGGAVPVPDGGPASVVVVTTKMNKVLEVDEEERIAWVQPGVLNLDLSRKVAHLGLHFAPDPSSQQACTIGGNVANNSGGPHCLSYGVTSSHVLAIEMVAPDGSVLLLGGLDPEPIGYDLRAAFIGSEGTMGIATRIAVRLTPLPPAVKTVLLGFPTLDNAANVVSRIIAAGYIPAAMELMDQRITEAVEQFVHAGLPVDAAAVLLVEVDGTEAAVEEAAQVVTEVARQEDAISSQIAPNEAIRAVWWKARKSAFGALARIAPNYYLHDGVVPRTRLTETLRGVCAIAESFGVTVVNVAHAGDGNLHPIIPYDGRDEDQSERVHEAGSRIAQLCVTNGGALSGEHGIGLEKRDLMGLLFADDDLVEQDRLRLVFDPERTMNPHKVLPEGSRCGEVTQLLARKGKVWT